MSFRALTTDERSRLEQASTGAVPTLEDLVASINSDAQRVTADASITTAEVDELAYQLGVDLGRHLIEQRPELEWAVLTDDYGTDLAVYNPAHPETFAAPIPVVRARLEPLNDDDMPAGQALIAFVERFLRGT